MTLNTLNGRSVLTLGELTPAEVRFVIDRAMSQKALWEAGSGRSRPLEGLTAALVFMKPSLRTRVSFEVACRRLGIDPVVLGAGDAFSRGESVHDTVKTLERYVDVIVVRTFEQSHVEEIAANSKVPVINALSDDYHPCQVLADLLTIEEHKGRIAGLRMAYVGDGNNMANTYLLGGALTGMHVKIASPEGYEPPRAVLDEARTLALHWDTGAILEVTRDPVQAAEGADVVVTDTWASMGQESEREARVAAFQGYTVDGKLMTTAATDAIFMHCLPAHRGEEVTDEVIDGPASVVFDEAENRLYAQQALLSAVLET